MQHERLQGLCTKKNSQLASELQLWMQNVVDMSLHPVNNPKKEQTLQNKKNQRVPNIVNYKLTKRPTYKCSPECQYMYLYKNG